MEPIMMFIIATIIVAILLVAFNKQQEDKVSDHLYTNDVQQLYQLTTAEYKINALENHQLNKFNHIEGTEMPNIAQELDRLTMAFNNGEIPLNELNSRLDYLLNMFNTDHSGIMQAY